MTPEELKEILRQPEGLKLDFKKEFKLNSYPPTGTDKQKWKSFVDGQWGEFIKDILGLTNGNVGTAGQPGYLVIGAGDDLKEDGSRELFDTSDLDIDEGKIIDKVNSACDPPLPRIHCEKVKVDNTFLTVITIPPTPYVHETSRDLQTTTGEFDDQDRLRYVKKDTFYIARTVFVRRNEGTKNARATERKALEAEKSQRRAMPKVLFPFTFLLILLLGVFGYFWVRSPAEKGMSGEFNVAVAEFTLLDPDGSTARGKDGRAVGDFICTRLQSGFSEMDLGNVNYQIWCPEQVGKVMGITPDERAVAAGELAEQIGAQVIIYGVITQREQSELAPEFYVSSKGFEQVDELVGQHELGSPMRVVLPFDPTQIQDVENPALSARANALSLITVGLAYYSVDSLDQALDYFQRAESIPGWLQNAGKEVVYLMIGNTNVRLASVEKAPSFLDPAFQAYEKALLINPAYARSLVGQAGVLYLDALGDPYAPMDTVDLDKLEQSELAFENALASDTLPESANIETKAYFGLGQIYLVRDQLQENGWSQKASEAFQKVIHDYENGDERVVDLASQAYARLALIAKLDGDFTTADDYYRKAIEIATPFYDAYYHTRLGELYAANGQLEEAIDAYQEAIRIAEFYGDEESVNLYTKRLNELKASQPQT
ncbi:tetratricopeptide repeat protein [Chloroflexota bacterium]